MIKKTWFDAYNMAMWLCVDVGVEPTSALKQSAYSHEIDDIEGFVDWGLSQIEK